MLIIKIQTDDGLKAKPIPTNFGDVTLQRYAEMKDADLKKKTLDERLSARTGIDAKLFPLMNFTDINRLITLTEFADDDIELYEQSKKTMIAVRKMNIARDTYGKLEKAKQIINKSESGFYHAIIEIVHLYTGKKVGDKLAVKVFAYVTEFIKQLDEFLTKYKRLTEYEPSEDEVEAGIEVLKTFGSFPTVVSLARSLGKSYDEVLQMSASEVYTTLLLDFEEAEIRKNLQGIHKRNNRLK